MDSREHNGVSPTALSNSLEEKLMADREIPDSTQHRAASPPDQQPAGQDGESHWTVALKSIFWFIVVPAGVLLLVKWFLQP